MNTSMSRSAHDFPWLKAAVLIPLFAGIAFAARGDLR